MYELPDEIWELIKNYVFEWKKYHQLKLKPILKNNINNRFREIYKRYTLRPIPNNTNIILRNDYRHWSEGICPRPNLELTSITLQKNNSQITGIWAGYGWDINYNKKNEY